MQHLLTRSICISMYIYPHIFSFRFFGYVYLSETYLPGQCENPEVDTEKSHTQLDRTVELEKLNAGTEVLFELPTTCTTILFFFICSLYS